MDNRSIDITSEGMESLGLALEIIWGHQGNTVTHFKDVKLLEKVEYIPSPKEPDDLKKMYHLESFIQHKDGTPTLILLRRDEQEAKELPFPLDFKGAKQFVEGWLNQVDFGERPDHDGDNEKGWRVFTDDWGHVAGHHSATVGIQPDWAMCCK